MKILQRLLPASAHIFGQRNPLVLIGVSLFTYALGLTISSLVLTRASSGDFNWLHWLGLAVWVGVFYLLSKQTDRVLSNADRLLLVAAGLMTGWGLLTIWRLTTVFGLRQTIWLGVAGAVFLLGLRLSSDLQWLRRYKYLWLTTGLLLTSLTFLFGVNPLGIGPRLWLGCCGVYIQPSEPLKLLLIVFLAAYLADRQPLTTRTGLLLAPTAVMMAVATLMLLAQRDLGTAFIFVLIYTTVIYTATNKRRVLVGGAAMILLAAFLGSLLFDVVDLRMEAWLNPWLDPSGRSYQIIQSIMAVSAGGMFGRGPGLGIPYVVPVSHSDFIFSSIVEESGLVGALALITVLALFALQSLQIARRSSGVYHRYLATGLAVYFAGQSILIMGGNVRLLPLTGVTLPFVSYGGSSLVTSFAGLLLLMHISHANPPGQRARFNPIPILNLGAMVLIAFGALAAMLAWWSLVRGPDLLTRNDNPRRAFSDRYVLRGALLDRNGLPLSVTEGEIGSLQRSYPYDGGGSVLGYNHPNYGQSGVEAGLDPILRGYERQSALSLWTNHILFGQPPPGLDVRLSIDIELQRRAKTMLVDQTGALVMMDAVSGEILAMVSAPSFDANILSEDWENLVGDENAPLLNRATQGRYQPGTALNIFLYAAALAHGTMPSPPSDLSHHVDGIPLECARTPLDPTDWPEILSSGCPGAGAEMGLFIGSESLLMLFENLNFYSTPVLPMPSVEALSPATAISIPEESAIGQGDLLISPLQLALAAAAISADGKIPQPVISLSVKTDSGWQEYAYPTSPAMAIPGFYSNRAAEDMRAAGLPIWEMLGSALNGPDQMLTWYLAGTLPGNDGTPIVIVVLLEADFPALAQSTGQALLREILTPTP